MTMNLKDPGNIAATAEKIYDEHYRESFEVKHPGEFAVIDARDGKAYHGEFAEQVLQEARKLSPNGVFHLIRIGAPGAFRVSYVGEHHADPWNWTLRPAG